CCVYRLASLCCISAPAAVLYPLSLHDALPISLRYLVAECITRSAPCSSERCNAGEAKVLSTTTSRPCRFAIAETACRSTIFSSGDRKSTRLNSSHVKISYAVFCLKKKKNIKHY